MPTTFTLPDNFHVSDDEFRASKREQELVYRDEGGRQATYRSYVDELGHARWDTDYVTLRMAGYSHPDALQEMRVRIRESWQVNGMPAPLPPLESHVPPPQPPVPPQPTLYTAQQVAALYTEMSKASGFKPDHTTTHDQQMRFLQQVLQKVRSTDMRWWMKRADPGRPISNEAIVLWVSGTPQSTSQCWDIIVSAGTPNYVVQAGAPVGDFAVPPQVLVNPATLGSIS